MTGLCGAADLAELAHLHFHSFCRQTHARKETHAGPDRPSELCPFVQLSRAYLAKLGCEPAPPDVNSAELHGTCACVRQTLAQHLEKVCLGKDNKAQRQTMR